MKKIGRPASNEKESITLPPQSVTVFRFLYYFMLNTNVHDERLFKQEKSIHTKCDKPPVNGQAAGSSVVCIQNVSEESCYLILYDHTAIAV